MRIHISCLTCSFNFQQPRQYYVNVGFRDDMRYELTCDLGHHTVTILQEEKYEILFEIGVNALVDGYYREGVVSFASALERFYQFALEVILNAGDVGREDFRSTWKVLSVSSERQLGAFAVLWLRQFGNPPELLKSGRVAFRNDVVHKGRIPELPEAIAFGDDVLSIILPKLAILREELPDSVMQAGFDGLQDRRTEADRTQRVGSMSIPTIFRNARTMPTELNTVSSHLELVRQQRRNF